MRSTGRSGSLCVEGTIGVHASNAEAILRFSEMRFDPSLLADLAREATQITRRAGERL